ncbi:hypothetical protein LMG28138_06094 [Pararobbsia alpina]|uniref:IS66 family insertion sequence element accessory protein TnpB n=2 Tax=Pararobbsia alpina TaxID=621374 RepID=A0A6S7D794_9BURK|nr:hypothetical protein LMG28138_06094 [Pararobbsia alpina]
MQPGVSIAAVALHYRMNANLLRRWLKAQEERSAAPALSGATIPAAEFVPLQLCDAKSSEVSQDIVVELRRGASGHVALARERCWRVRAMAAGMAQMIRIEAMWLATEPLDMRAGADTILARVVKVFGAARPHHAYLFANKSSTRMKVLIYDGLGIWLAARRLNKGRFVWSDGHGEPAVVLNAEQLDALVKGLAWQTLAFDHAIRVV